MMERCECVSQESGHTDAYLEIAILPIALWY